MNCDETMVGVMPVAPALPQPVDRAVLARRAASVLFLVDGMTFGTWAALIPAFQQKFGLSTGQVSAVLVGLVVGSMATMTQAGGLISRHGSHRVGYVMGIAFPSALLALVLAPSFGWFIAAGVLFGACKGVLDIAVTAQGLTVENALSKPVVSSFNGFWSTGGLAAAALSSFALHHGTPLSLLVGLMAALLVGTTLMIGRFLLADEPVPVAQTAPRRFSLPNRRLLCLGGLAFLALFSEGVLLDWSSAYAHSVTQVSLATAPIAFAAFSVCMAIGRFSGDWLAARVGSVGVLYVSAALMMAGMALAVSVHIWAAVLAGFMMVGLGIANLVPTIFRAAGKAHEQGASHGVALVSTLGYTGFLCGPPVVGFMAVLAGLPTAFGLVIVFGLIVALTGKAALMVGAEAQ